MPLTRLSLAGLLLVGQKLKGQAACLSDLLGLQRAFLERGQSNDAARGKGT
jgi:hypothetical protein